jgi:hypothetical protein
MWAIRRFARLFAISLLVVGMNAAYLVSWFIIIRMLSRFWPFYVWDAGKLIMKSCHVNWQLGIAAT